MTNRINIHAISACAFPSDNGQAVRTIKMANALARDAGHDVTLFATGMAKAQARIFEYYGIGDHLKLNLSRFRGPVRIAQSLAAIARLGRPDLYYGSDMVTLALVSKAGIPVMLDLDRLPNSAIERWAAATLINSGNLKGVVTVTQGLRDDWLRDHPSFDRQRLLVAPNGADMPVGNPPPLGSWPGRTTVPQIGYVGGLRGPGPQLVVTLAERLPEMDFHIIGGSKRDLKSWRGRDLPRNLHLQGFVPHNRLPSILARFDVMLNPCPLKWMMAAGHDAARWMSPLSMFESMAAAKPILASESPALREILTSGENAGLLPPDQPGAWVDAICYLVKDRSLAQAIATRAQNDVDQHYKWAVRAGRVTTFMNEILER